ncbi:hypothetical protein VST7929_00598 [Vibrio stylophorae]|uniref:UPF0303 protein VST7929_00598 n=1 Tax=Vibrio stylophorae TaxID=659351 RepID=A0ABN8DTN6_9VIBR|nr:heme-degrading domain-containing protein [Vibrio stylophorae]CAH0532752.1 hypothetical protein VST7929_00598 [Vibrio stylophorae]
MTPLLIALQEQEQALSFERFDHAYAWQLGEAIKQEAENRGVNVAIDITFNGQTLFYYAMPTTTQDNAEWIRRKRNVVQRWQHSSWYMGRYYEAKGKTMAEAALVDARDYAPYGGSYPLTIRHVGVVGSITVSGLPQQADHQLIVDVLTRFLATMP